MSTFRNPVGPQSSKVYWRRRLVVLLGLVAVVAIIVFLLPKPTQGSPTGAAASASPTPSSSSSPDAAAPVTPVEAPIAGGPCNPAAVKLVSVTDKNSYAAGELPQLSFTITNTTATPCTYNVGTTQQTYRITSGQDQYWSSKDCEIAPVDAPILLEPNVPQSPAPIAWDRTRSSKTTCDAQRPAVPAGGATYNLKVSVGAVESAALRSFLLN